MNARGNVFLISFSAMLIAGCKKPYTPPAVTTSVNYLVVEGVINAAADSTIINLSRTVSVSGKIGSNAELGATVTVESDQNTAYPLQELGKGRYGSSALNIDPAHKYRLHIFTMGNKEYVSDLEPVKPTPPIDSVGFVQQDSGIQLYLNSHDPNNSTRYYRWEYNETWQFHAKYESLFITDGKQLHYRTPDQQIYYCFGNDTSSTILLGSTAALVKDVIYQAPLTQILSTSEKLETRYSIVVRQYALTGPAYSFYQNLKKNTEQLGSIFSAQPSEVAGNVHCVTVPSEPVIGYVSVTNVQQKRIFIDESQLPQNWFPTYPYTCTLDSLLLCHNSCQDDVALFLIPLGSSELAIEPATDKFGNLLGYLASDHECADCTIRGTTKQPVFWK
jgi:hypothetical protein